MTGALLIVDVQRYYLEPEAAFVGYFESQEPGATAYISRRCREMVLPNIAKVLKAVRAAHWPVVYLRLCGTAPDRSDLHHHFLESHRKAARAGFPDLYPLASQPLAEVCPEIAPLAGEIVFDKTTYSGFTRGDLEQRLKGIDLLVMTGLATSQCVETTARDASERGFEIVHLEDCQADYHDITHRCSLFSSRGVCGGEVWGHLDFLNWLSQQGRSE
jgi:nicotinamidase-related amidase